jgi:hypothetical protein
VASQEATWSWLVITHVSIGASRDIPRKINTRINFVWNIYIIIINMAAVLNFKVIYNKFNAIEFVLMQFMHINGSLYLITTDL